MAYYYLVASLQSLQIGDEPPFSTEEYIVYCAQWIGPREEQILRKVLLEAPDIAPCRFCREWNEVETQLRNAVARLRAQKLGVDARDYLQPHESFSGLIESLVQDAMSSSDPLEMEEELDRVRWRLADGLVGEDPFGFNKVLAYGIQLKIVERWHRMDVHAGKEKLETVIVANTEQKAAAG